MNLHLLSVELRKEEQIEMFETVLGTNYDDYF